ncbi:MAG: patatin-like phospholipase family protein [Planctomycetales bacterium]|nr:patatin-like phospholipase family protein [Planctomycetales bacterium]
MIAQLDHTKKPQSAVLALGGGGARGLAHFGAMQAVGEYGFSVERIVGVSVGSLAGAMAALDDNPQHAQAQVLEYLASEDFASKQEALFGAQPTSNKTTSGLLAWYDQIKSYLWAHHLLGRVFRRRSLLAGHVLEDVIAQLVPDIDISETKIPLSIVTVDLRSGHPVLLERGSLRRAIAASAAIPGIFPPVEWEGMLLCDVGVLDSLPTAVAQSYHRGLVIGVDVGPSMEHIEDCDSALHILLRMDEIGERLYRRHSYPLADILIQPDVGHCQWFEFEQPQRLIQAGLDAGRQALEQWFRQHSPPPPAVIEPTTDSRSLFQRLRDWSFPQSAAE